MDTLLPLSRYAFSLRWLFFGVAFLLSHAGLRAAVVPPDRPENYLLDQGSIFPPDVARRMEAELKACARDYDVHIYVMTVPSFKVMPSRVAVKLPDLVAATRDEWLKGKVGAVIIFDDEAGLSPIGESDEARNVFPPLALNRVIKDPRLISKKKLSAPEKLAGNVSLLIQQLTDLRVKANAEARKQRIMNFAFASIAGLAVLGGVSFGVVKWRTAKAARKRKRRRVHLHQ